MFQSLLEILSNASIDCLSQLAIDRALYPHQAAKDKAKSFFPLKKAASLGKEFDQPVSASSKRDTRDDDSGSFSAKEKGIQGVARSFSGMPVSSSGGGGGVAADDAVEKLMFLAPKNGSIKGGSAKAFKPTLSDSFRCHLLALLTHVLMTVLIHHSLTHSPCGVRRFKSGSAEDGLFLDRTTQDAMIEQVANSHIHLHPLCLWSLVG